MSWRCVRKHRHAAYIHRGPRAAPRRPCLGTPPLSLCACWHSLAPRHLQPWRPSTLEVCRFASGHFLKIPRLQTCANMPHVAAVNLCCPTQAMGKHPNIVELLGQDRMDHVMVMEQGSSDMYKLVKKMGTEKGVPEYMMASWAQGICAGVSHMHACGYVHQDLKSSNVLVFGDRTVRLSALNFASLGFGGCRSCCMQSFRHRLCVR